MDAIHDVRSLEDVDNQCCTRRIIIDEENISSGRFASTVCHQGAAM
jgi:hypothetical protein